MAMMRFFQVQLRTSDVEAARAFYATVLGDGARNIVQLHQQSVARGARPHWLGYLDVDDVDAAAAGFAERGAIPLGPKWVNAEGLEAAVVRDPGGAVLALAKPPAGARGIGCGADVVWFSLNTADVERAMQSYRTLFGWESKPPIDLGSSGVIHPFAWEPGGAPVGSMSDIRSRPSVHAHWLFHFRVDALEPAIEAVRDGGGSVVGPITLPSAERVAICDDPQGAAFAIHAIR
jgi:predicted enzyme related to lactoylglutathione lyase